MCWIFLFNSSVSILVWSLNFSKNVEYRYWFQRSYIQSLYYYSIKNEEKSRYSFSCPSIEPNIFNTKKTFLFSSTSSSSSYSSCFSILSSFLLHSSFRKPFFYVFFQYREELKKCSLGINIAKDCTLHTAHASVQCFKCSYLFAYWCLFVCVSFVMCLCWKLIISFHYRHMHDFVVLFYFFIYSERTYIYCFLWNSRSIWTVKQWMWFVV